MDVLIAVLCGWGMAVVAMVAGAVVALKAGRGPGLFSPMRGAVSVVPDEFAPPDEPTEDEMAKVFDERANRFMERLRDGQKQASAA